MKKLLLSAAALVAFGLHANVQVRNLSVEGRKDNPLGLDVTTPRLGWQLVADADEHDVLQTSYHILVASHPDTLALDRGDLWDAQVASDQSLWIDYHGTPLRPNQRAYWKVSVGYSVGQGRPQSTSWSEVASWGAGLLSEGNWKGQWIGYDHANLWDVEDVHSRLSARYFRTRWKRSAKKVRQATLHIAGLGLYEATLNNRKVGQDVLAPAPTNYDKSIIYNTYDVTSYILEPNSSLQDDTPAENCLMVAVSNGRYYTMQQGKKKYKIRNFGYPKLRANLIIEYEDGTQETIATNEKQWQLTCDGPIRSSNEYDGEIYDARKASLDDGWMTPERCEIPDGWLRGNTTPNMRVIDTLSVRACALTRRGTLLVDFGQNFAGNVNVSLVPLGLHEGDTLRIRWAEKLVNTGSGHPLDGYILSDSSELYVENLRNAQSTDLYIADGRERLAPVAQWTPSFCYHGGRFVELSVSTADGHPYAFPTSFLSPSYSSATSVSSNLKYLQALVISDPMETLYTFETPNKLLNQIVTNAFWGVRSNYKGMPVDCPQRDERQPWVGDHSMGCWGESYLMDNRALYLKWMQDLEDSQKSDGQLPGVAPAFWNYYNDDISWPSVFIFAADMLYTQFGDVEAIRRHYPAMRRWVMHFWHDHRDPITGVIKADKYADWCCPPESPELIHSQDPSRVTDGVLIGSCYLYRIFQDMMEFDQILTERIEQASPTERIEYARQGLTPELLRADSEEYHQCRQSLREAINAQFLHDLTSPASPTTAFGTAASSASPLAAAGRGRAPRTMTAPGNHILYPDSVFYSNNSVTANLLPWAFGIVPDEHAATVERWIMRKHLLLPGANPELKNVDGHIQCGVIGMSWLLRGLADMGRMDIAYMLATVSTYPSWGYMVEHGATTIWELWNGDTANPKMNSGNHIMLLGDLIPWCMECIGGIRAAAPAFRTIRFAPHFELAELPEAHVSYLTPYGKAESHWRRTDRRLVWDITIPCNASGEVHLPFNAILPADFPYTVLPSSSSAGLIPASSSSGLVPVISSSVSSPTGVHIKARATRASRHPRRSPLPTAPHPAPVLHLGSGHHHLEFALDPSLPLRDHRTGGAYERQYADSLNADRRGIVTDQFVYDMLTAAHPSCHSASIAELTNGDLLCTFFLGAREGAPDVCIYTSRKPKGSDEWQPLQLVANGDLRPGARTWGTEIDSTLTEPIVTNVNRKACYNPVLFQIPDGDLLLFYKIGKNVRDWTGYLMRSSDGGHTWSDPRMQLQPMSDPPASPQLLDVQCSDSLLGAIKNQPIWLPRGFRCADGTVLQRPRILSPSSKETATASKDKAGLWRCYIEMSEDEGHTWAAYGPITGVTTAADGISSSPIRAIQPALLVHPDGRIQMLCRTARPKDDDPAAARMATAWSNDGGLTWSPLALLPDLPNNNSGIGAVTLPDGTFALVYNPFSFVPGPDKPLRNPTCIATSNDGIHWQHRLTLEPSPISQYSYPSLLVDASGDLHAIYTWRRLGIKYQKIHL